MQKAISASGPRRAVGMWRREGGGACRPHTVSPRTFLGQISEILGELPQDPDVWRRLGAKYRIDLFCGVFMGSANDGLSFPGDLLKLLCERSIALNLDIYAPRDD
jgi:hypothetical protein